MINSTLQTKLDAAIRNAIRSVLESDPPPNNIDAMREVIDDIKRESSALANHVMQEASAVSSTIYELENLDTSDLDYALDALSELLPASNTSTE